MQRANLMHPESVGAHKRLDRQLREAALRATTTERTDLQRLQRLIHSEAIGVLEAQRLLRDFIRRQHERHTPQRQAA